MTLGTEQLSEISFAAAAVWAAIGALILLKHESVSQWTLAFPRSRFWGILLTAAALLWSAFLINSMTLGDLGKYKWLLYILTPLSFFLIVRYLDELLAPRALGGLLMLLPTLLLDAARWHASGWRLIVVVLAYVMVIAGIWLMLCPFNFRIWMNQLLKNALHRRLGVVVSASIALLLLITGVITR